MILSGSEASKSAVSTWNERGTASSLQTSSIRPSSIRRTSERPRVASPKHFLGSRRQLDRDLPRRFEEMRVPGPPSCIDEIPAGAALIQVYQEGQFVIQAQLAFHEEAEKLLVAVASTDLSLSYHRFCPYRPTCFSTVCDRSRNTGPFRLGAARLLAFKLFPFDL